MATKKVIRINKGAPTASDSTGQPAAAKPGAAKATPKRRARGSSLAPLYIIIGVVIVFAGVVYYNAQKKAKAARVVAMKVRNLHDEAAVHAQEVTDICKTVIALAPLSEGMIEATQASVRTVLNKDITRRLNKQTPTARPARAPAADTADKADKSDKPAGRSAPPANSEMQDGRLTPEALAARHARNAARQADVQPAAAGDKAAARTPNLSMSMRPGLRKKRVDPPIWVAGRAVCDGVQELQINVSLARDLIQLVASDLEATRRDFYLEQVQAKAAGYDARKQEATELHTGAKAGITQAKAAIVTVKQLETAHVNAERERLAEEKRVQEADARKQVETRELAAASAVAAAMDQRFPEYSYAESLADGERVLATLTAPLAIRKCKLAVDQYKELVKMKGYMIEQLNRAPLRWGWRQDKPMRDITGADADGMKTLNSSVTWAQVSPGQFEYVMKHFFADERTIPSLKVKYGPGVALYYLKRGNNKEAQFYANRTIDGSGSERDYVRRLIPIAD